MFKFIAILLVVAVTVSAKPHLLAAPVAYNAQLVAASPAIVTAHISQIIARNYNGLASASLVAAPALAYSAPVAYSAYSSPIAYSAYAAPAYSAIL